MASVQNKGTSHTIHEVTNAKYLGVTSTGSDYRFQIIMVKHIHEITKKAN